MPRRCATRASVPVGHGPATYHADAHSRLGVLMGIPEYMSPEQAELKQLDIDTRSNIYSLGVLLYELLTGTTPLTHEMLQQVALEEMLRRIRDELAKLGIEVSEFTIRKYRPKRHRSGQTWKTFLHRHVKDLVAVDYHTHRTHRSLDRDCPETRPIEYPDQGDVIELPLLGGLHHRYSREAA